MLSRSTLGRFIWRNLDVLVEQQISAFILAYSGWFAKGMQFEVCKVLTYVRNGFARWPQQSAQPISIGCTENKNHVQGLRAFWWLLWATIHTKATTMAPAKKLSDTEKATILAHDSDGFCPSNIGILFGSHRKTILRFLHSNIVKNIRSIQSKY